MKPEKILEQEVKVSYQDRLLRQQSIGRLHLPLPPLPLTPQQVLLPPQQVPLPRQLRQPPRQLQQRQSLLLRQLQQRQRQQKQHQLTVQHVQVSEAE